MIARRFLLLALAAVALSSCKSVVRSPDLDFQAASAFDMLRQHRNQALEQRFDPTMRGPDFAGQLVAVEGMLPTDTPRSRRALSTSLFISDSGTIAAIVDEYDYADHTALLQLRLHRAAGAANWEMQGLHVQVATHAELAVNDLTLAGKTAGQYAFVVLMVASPLLILAALRQVLTTRGLRRKWLWCLVALFGVGAFRMDWTDGAVTIEPLYLQFLGAGVVRDGSPFAPWILSVALPVGAILILAGIWARPRQPKEAGGAGTA